MFCCPDGTKVDIFQELCKKSITHYYTEIKLTCSSCQTFLTGKESIGKVTVFLTFYLTRPTLNNN